MQALTSRTRLTTVALATAFLVPITSVAVATPGSHGDGDGQASGRQVADGPSTAGLAWRTDLGVELANEPRGSILSSNGLALYQGRASSDVPSTPEDEGAGSRGVLYAIDPTDGSVEWGGPAMDVEHSCLGVATSDDRIIVQLDASSPTNASSDSSLVAIDATTGDRLAGQIYNGEDEDGDRLNVCDGRLVLTEDESLVLVETNTFLNGRVIRAIDIDTWTQAWEIDLRDIDDNANMGTRNTPLLSTDGDGVYAIYRWENTGSVETSVYRLERFDLADGTSEGHVDLPGSQQYVGDQESLAVDGGVVTMAGYCPGAPADAPDDDCLVMYDDADGTFTQRWITYTPAEASGLASALALMDDDTIGGFSAAGSIPSTRGLNGFNVDTGAIEWSAGTPFSNNGHQFITDPEGNGYFGGFGEYHVRSVSADGEIRWGIEHCHLDGGLEPAIVGPIGYDGTLVTMTRNPDNDSKEVIRGFRTGEGLPKGDCPEEEERVSGVSRVETSVEISNVSFADQSDVVVLATSTNYPDALAGGPLARTLNAPLLLTRPEALSPETRAEIERLGARTAVLLGGVGALSSAVEAELVQMGLAIDRVAGGNRFETAELISQRVPATTVYVTEGQNADPNRGWPDAVAVSGLASFEQRPILLVTRDKAPDATLSALDALNATEVVVVGGEGAVSAATAAALDGPGRTVIREAGASRFGTSVKIAERAVAAGASTFDLWFATGLSFPDALAAGPAVAKADGVLLLVHGTRTSGGSEVYAWLNGLADEDVLRATFIGGAGALTDDVANALLDAAGIQP